LSKKENSFKLSKAIFRIQSSQYLKTVARNFRTSVTFKVPLSLRCEQ